YRVALPGFAVYVKHYRVTDLRGWLREFVRPAKALAEFRRTLSVAALSIPTIEPLAVGWRAGRAGRGDSFLVTRSLDDAEALSTFVENRLHALHPAAHARLRQEL